MPLEADASREGGSSVTSQNKKNLSPEGSLQDGAPTSKANLYKLEYRNDANEIIKTEERYEPWNKLQTATDAGDPDSILDIVTYVTIRSLAVSSSVSSTDGATAAANKVSALQSPYKFTLQ